MVDLKERLDVQGNRVPDGIKREQLQEIALLRQDTPLGKVRALAVAYEAAAWDDVGILAAALGVPERALPALADEARAWAATTLPA